MRVCVRGPSFHDCCLLAAAGKEWRPQQQQQRSAAAAAEAPTGEAAGKKEGRVPSFLHCFHTQAIMTTA